MPHDVSGYSAQAATAVVGVAGYVRTRSGWIYPCYAWLCLHNRNTPATPQTPRKGLAQPGNPNTRPTHRGGHNHRRRTHPPATRNPPAGDGHAASMTTRAKAQAKAGGALAVPSPCDAHGSPWPPRRPARSTPLCGGSGRTLIRRRAANRTPLRALPRTPQPPWVGAGRGICLVVASGRRSALVTD